MQDGYISAFVLVPVFNDSAAYGVVPPSEPHPHRPSGWIPGIAWGSRLIEACV